MSFKRLILALALLTAQFAGSSQDFYLGLRGGYNRATLSADASPSLIKLQDRNAWNLAFTYNFKAEKIPVGFSFETGYVQKGAKTNVDSLDYQFHFLAMPILLDIYPIKRLRISVGPEVSYLMAAKNRANDSTKVNLLNTYDNRVEFSGSIGASFSLSFFADLGVRYNQSFTPIAKQDPVLDRRNLFNQYFQIFLLLKIAN